MIKNHSYFFRLAVISAAFFAVSGGYFGMQSFPSEAQETDTADESNDIQKDIDKIENKLERAQKEKKLLEQNLLRIQQTLTLNQNEIAKLQGRVSEVKNSIERKVADLEIMETNMEVQKIVLGTIIQELAYSDQTPFVATMLGERDFSDMMKNVDHLSTMRDKVNEMIVTIAESKEIIALEKENLDLLRAEQEALVAKKQSQKYSLLSTKSDAVDQIEEKEATISELQTKLSKLRSDLSDLLGIVVSTDDVKKAAGIASDATGVRKSFILAELTQESGLGRFTGGCTYKNTRVKPAEAAVFKIIMKELGYDVNSKKISCAGRIGYGGAMGIAQFMPRTWGGLDGKHGYVPYISSATGHKPPDPWSVIDGVMGMAKKLANGGATSKKGEYAASMIYYCGTSRPANAKIKTACNNYAASVQRLTNGYEKNN